MEYHTSRRQERHYNLIMLLLTKISPQSKGKMAKRLGCSRPTLNTTIISANQLIKKYGEIVIVDEGLVLKLNKNFSQRQLRGVIIQQTLIFSFLNELFFKPLLSVSNWSSVNYMSKSSMYKYILETDNYLNLMDIKLEFNKNEGIYLIGKEWQIRYLYMQLLRDVFLLDGRWPFADINYSEILEIVKEICQEVGVYIGPISEYQYALFIGVHIQRFKLRKAAYSYEYELAEGKVEFFNQDKKLRMILNRLELLCLTELPDIERGMIISTVEIFPTYYLSKESMNQRLAYDKHFHHDFYELALDCMEINEGVADEQSLDFHKYLDVFLPLRTIPYFQETSLEYFQSKERGERLLAVSKNYTKKIELIERRIAEMIDPSFFERNRFYIISKLNQLYRASKQALRKKEPTIVTVMSQHGPAQEEIYIQKLKKHFSDIAIKIIESEEVHLANKWQSIDLYIGDFKVMNLVGEERFLLIDEHLNKRSLLEIDKKIKEIASRQST